MEKLQQRALNGKHIEQGCNEGIYTIRFGFIHFWFSSIFLVIGVSWSQYLLEKPNIYRKQKKKNHWNRVKKNNRKLKLENIWKEKLTLGCSINIFESILSFYGSCMFCSRYKFCGLKYVWCWRLYNFFFRFIIEMRFSLYARIGFPHQKKRKTAVSRNLLLIEKFLY